MNSGQIIETSGIVAASTRGTLITASSTPNTKGTYTQILAATARDYHSLMIVIGANSAASDALMDIAIGGAGSEQIIVPNLYSAAITQNNMFMYMFPLSVPVGSRLAARVQSTTGSATVRVSIYGLTYSFATGPLAGVVTDYGLVTADSGGISVDSGAVANTKGAYSELVASASRNIRGFVIAFGGQVNTIRAQASWLVDLAIGGAGSEQVVLADLPITSVTANDELTPYNTPFIPLFIPAGSRIAARSQCTTTDATDRLIDIMLWGVD